MKWCTSEEFAPLMLVVSGPEKYKLVATLFQAAEMLTVSWPIDDGEEYLLAIKGVPTCNSWGNSGSGRAGSAYPCR
nr:DUF982 domain-containing protein [Rhizobium laguerreae]